MQSTNKFNRLRAIALTGVLGFALAATGLPAQARDGASGRTRAPGAQQPRPPRSGDYSRHTEVARTGDGHTRTDTWSNERGTATREARVANDRAQQTRTRDVEWTGPQGQQAQRTDVTQRTGSGYTRQSTATGPQGGKTERNVEATRDAANGTWSKDVTVQRTPPANGGG
jgi:hypothetical protein